MSTFIEAVQAVLDDKAANRPEWPKGTYLVSAAGSEFILLYDNQYRKDWYPSVEAILATDWVIVDNPIKVITTKEDFQAALLAAYNKGVADASRVEVQQQAEQVQPETQIPDLQKNDPI